MSSYFKVTQLITSEMEIYIQYTLTINWSLCHKWFYDVKRKWHLPYLTYYVIIKYSNGFNL